MPRKKSLFKIPRTKIGNLHISSKGISASTKTPVGTYNTRKGLTPNKSILGIIFQIIKQLIKT